MTDSGMSIADAVDEDRDSGASTATNPCMQRGSGDSEKGLCGVVPFIERNPDKVASTLEWRGRVLHSQEATQATNSRQQHTAEERWRASLKIEIERIRQHYREQESIIEEEVVKHEQRYKWAIEQLEKEEKDEEGYSVAQWWEVELDYQPTECGNDRRWEQIKRSKAPSDEAKLLATFLFCQPSFLVLANTVLYLMCYLVLACAQYILQYIT
jgi:hypothetical protein